VIPAVFIVVAIVLSFQTLPRAAGHAAAASTSSTPTPGPGTPTPGTVTATPRTSGTATATATVSPIRLPTASLTPRPTATATSGPVQEPTPPAHYVVMIVIDGGRPSYLSLAPLPHIQALIKHGVMYDRAWVGEQESSTPDVHVTFGTGTLPRENGFLGFGWAATDTRKWVDFRTLLADGQIDPVLKSLPTPSVAARLHQFMPGAVSVAASGHKDYATVGLGGGAADYELYGKFVNKMFVPDFMHAPPPLTTAEQKSLTLKTPLPLGAEDSWAFSYASIVAHHVKPRLLMINLPETDTWGHWKGPADTPVFAYLMRNIDRGIGQIESTYRSLGILGQTDFIITADHAMIESRPARNWNLVQVAARQVGAQVARADGTGGAIWLQNPAQARAVAERLVAMKPDHVEAIFYRSNPGLTYSFVQASPMSWLVKPAVSAALKYLIETTAGIHGPDVWVLYRENYTVLWTNVTGTWKGTHGGTSWKTQNVPLIMSGPDIRQGVHSQFPARAIDIAPTLERLLGLPAIHRDGVILADAFSDPMPGEEHAQKAIAGQLDAYVSALAAQSQADGTGVPHPWTQLPGLVKPCDPKGKGPTACTTTAANATNG